VQLVQILACQTEIEFDIFLLLVEVSFERPRTHLGEVISHIEHDFLLIGGREAFVESRVFNRSSIPDSTDFYQRLNHG
jgi:hypothetical protein